MILVHRGVFQGVVLIFITIPESFLSPGPLKIGPHSGAPEWCGQLSIHLLVLALAAISGS